MEVRMMMVWKGRVGDSGRGEVVDLVSVNSNMMTMKE